MALALADRPSWEKLYGCNRVRAGSHSLKVKVLVDTHEKNVRMSESSRESNEKDALLGQRRAAMHLGMAWLDSTLHVRNEK